jgi:glycerol-3-phosphate dehydrogenase
VRDYLTDQRGLTREALTKGVFDVLVIGGGIVGISTAWLAARAGLRVAVLDKGDFASATSSASSKLAHGGLRYMEHGEIKLVFENHRERRALGRSVAPHHVRPMPFLVAVYPGGPHNKWAVGAGMFAYTALSTFSDGVGRLISPRKAHELVPALRGEGMRGFGMYHDHQMNDARLAVTTARAAADAGAVLLNHAEVVAMRRTGSRVSGVDVRDRLTGAEFGVDARVVVNATGPWTDHLRRMEDPDAQPSVRLSKGAHLVLRQQAPWQAAVTVQLTGGRVSFAIPWEGQVLLGTTDEPYEDDPAGVQPTEADIDQILGEAGTVVAPEHLRRSDIVYSFAGLRVLPGGGGDTKDAKRETVITTGKYGMVSIAGGKWTTFRDIGKKVLGFLTPLLSLDNVDRNEVPLPGATQPEPARRALRAATPELPEDVIAHLVRHYGTISHELVALGLRDPSLLERVHPDGPDIWAQVAYAIDREWGYEVDDVLRRRTTLTVRGLDTPEIRKQVAELIEQ